MGLCGNSRLSDPALHPNGDFGNGRLLDLGIHLRIDLPEGSSEKVRRIHTFFVGVIFEHLKVTIVHVYWLVDIFLFCGIYLQDDFSSCVLTLYFLA